MITVLQSDRAAVDFGSVRGAESISLLFFGADSAALSNSPCVNLGAKANTEAQDETAFEKYDRARRGAVRAGVCRDGDADHSQRG